MATLKDLAARMNRAADNLDNVVADLRDDTAKFLTKRLIEITPVDTSKALSNWRVTTGAITADIPALSVGSGGSTRAASMASAIQDAAAAIDAANPKAVLVIFNSAKYIRRLNEGWSRQAPAGFVEGAVLLARLNLRKLKANVNTKRGRGSLNV